MKNEEVKEMIRRETVFWEAIDSSLCSMADGIKQFCHIMGDQSEEVIEERSDRDQLQGMATKIYPLRFELQRLRRIVESNLRTLNEP